MPVFGHAFVGLSVGKYIKPDGHDSVGASLWLLIVVVLSYIPDIASQICFYWGLRGVDTIVHSLIAAIVLSLITTAVLKVIIRLSIRKAFLISLCSILAHDILDRIYAPERFFLWPFSSWRPGFYYSLPPLSLIDEVLIFGSLYFISWLLYRLWFDKRFSQPMCCKTIRQKNLIWLSRIIVIVIFICAGTTHYLQKIRGEQFQQAKIILQTTKNYKHALNLLDEAGRWPYGASLAWVNYFKAQTFWRLGNIGQAERYYQESLAEDPRNFRSIADLALLYASGKEDIAQRRNRAEPYVRKLRTQYADNPFTKSYLDKIEVALHTQPGAAQADRTPASDG
jgi:hypothetical protein